MGYKILTFFFGGLITALLALTALILKNYVIDFSTRNMFGFGFSAILYFFLPAYFFLLGLILTAVVLQFNSLSIPLSVSILMALAVSWKTFTNAIEIYRRPDYFDKTFFYSDVFDIAGNFIIFPLTAFLIWKAKLHYFYTR